MAYIGRQLTAGNYLKLDDISSQFNGSTTQFNLTSGGQAFYPGSPFSILVSLAGIIQEPDSAYQIDQSTITFAIAPQASDDFFCIALGVSLAIGVPGEGTVTGSKFARPFNYDDGLLYLDDTNNKVGINSLSPSYDLDVNGDINLNGTFYQNGSQFVASRWTSGDGTDIYRLSDVGIGTTNPRFALEVGAVGASGTSLFVNGDARITGILTIGTASITLDGSNNAIQIGTGVTLTESGNANYSGVITATTFSGNIENPIITNYAETTVNLGTLIDGTNNIGLSTGNVFYGTLPTSGTVTFTFTTGQSNGASAFTLYLKNGASGTPTLVWPVEVIFPGGSAPDRTTTANKTDIWTFSTIDNGTIWYGDIAMYNL